MKTVILAAGFGSRLWPLSTSETPKQFLHLVHNESLISYTYRQLLKVMPQKDIYFLILEGMQPLVKQEIPEVDEANYVVVPERRNTLPHTLWALRSIAEYDDEPIMFKSVDHVIVNEAAFVASLRNCVNDYSQQRVTILGSVVKTFNSNDGYCVVDAGQNVKAFLEKPSKAVFDRAAQHGLVYRSPFIFISSVRAMAELVQESLATWKDDALALLKSDKTSKQRLFLNLPFIDISTALFAHAHNLGFKEIAYEFIDVGRFEEIYSLNAKDKTGNVHIGEHILLEGECRNNLIVNETNRPLVVISRSDSVIVQTDNGSLVASFTEARKVGDVYKQRIHSTH